MTVPSDAPLTPAPDRPPARPQHRFVVGIGASAGGLAAFSTFFDHMPPDSGMAFVLVQHLDPQQPNLLHELLASHTRMPVHPVVDRMVIAPDQVYLIPPNTMLTIDHDMLYLATPLEAHGRRMAIDHFFYSLAANHGANAIGIILSGTGTDGTLGLMAIKECGGMTLAQLPESAQYDAMPRSAIKHGVVHHVVPIAQMPAVLLAHARHGLQYPSPLPSDELPADSEEALHTISVILQQATGHDFSHYKPATLMRRIIRRMQVQQSGGLADYITRLQQDSQEANLLFQDLLIRVTHFFRDPEAFDALAETIIPTLFRSKEASSPVRVWVPGCATGEEAYTIAILLREHLAWLSSPPLQIFATDIDEAALHIARQGRYDETIATHVSAERLAQFFVQKEHSYQVTTAIRELCLFST